MSQLLAKLGINSCPAFFFSQEVGDIFDFFRKKTFFNCRKINNHINQSESSIEDNLSIKIQQIYIIFNDSNHYIEYVKIFIN